MKHLEQKEQQMIYYRYFEGKTQQEIAKIFHISQVQVSRIQKKDLKKTKKTNDWKYLKNYARIKKTQIWIDR